jgi:hypothetical protein
MADNISTLGGRVASDETTYSGQVDAHVQLMRIVEVVGAEGSKTVVTTPTLNANIVSSALPVTQATTDAITAKLATDALQNGLTALTPKFAPIQAAANGDNTLVSAVSGKKIRVIAIFVTTGGTVTYRLQSGASGAYLTGTITKDLVLPFNPLGWCETASGALLNLELSAAVNCGGMLVYVEV